MFFNCHSHSVYSVQDALSSPLSIAKKCKDMGCDAFFITDHGSLMSFVNAYEAAEKVGIQFIPGCEFYVKPESEFFSYNKKNNDDVEVADFAVKYHHLIAIAKNQNGLKSLIKINNSAEYYYGKPCVSRESIFNNSDGIIITTACVAGEIPFLVKNELFDKAKEVMTLYKNKFKEDYYFEIQYHNLSFINENDLYKKISDIASELNIKLLAATDSHYTNKEDEISHTIYKTLYSRTNDIFYDFEKQKFPGGFDGTGYHIKTEEEIREGLANLSFMTQEKINESINSSVEIRNKCEKTVFPRAKNLTDKSEELRKLADEGFNKRRVGTQLEEKSKERYEYELNVINNMKFSEYFINVKSITERAKMLGLLVGPGRGCFLPGNQVTTENGKKNIEDITINDKVLTKDGKYKQVQDLYKYNIEEECLKITLSNGKTIKCTSDHKILVNHEWIPASSLTIGTKLESHTNA